MIKPCAGEAGEGVDDADNMVVVIEHDKGVDRIVVHRLTGIYNLRVLIDGLWFACHDIRYGRTEEILPEAQHRTTYISVRHDTKKLIAIYHDADA